MGKLLNGYIMPHPPVIVPEIGGGRERQARATIEAMKRAAKEISADNPTTIILSTPHAPCFRDYVYIADSETLEGDFAAFGSPEVSFSFKNNQELAHLIIEKANHRGIQAGGLDKNQKQQYGISEQLDHGALVPLCFIKKELENFRLICISTPFMSFTELYDFGKCIQQAVEESDEQVVYVASGDLSHRLTPDAPSGYTPKGLEYDESLVDKVRRGDIKGILETDEELLEKAGECGTRSIIMMFGALGKLELKPEVYSYEGPFGVGYMIAKISVSGGSEYVKLAKETLETFVRSGEKIDIPEWIPQYFKNNRAGVFVSLKKNGMLRGCIGTIGPVRDNIAEEIICNAISAGTQDPRFPEVSADELKTLVYSVDVLGSPEKVNSMNELDVNKYGVIVTSGYRRGLLLPDLEGVDTPEQQVGIALQKAGINPTDDYEMERFEVIRYR